MLLLRPLLFLTSLPASCLILLLLFFLLLLQVPINEGLWNYMYDLVISSELKHLFNSVFDINPSRRITINRVLEILQWGGRNSNNFNLSVPRPTRLPQRS